MCRPSVQKEHNKKYTKMNYFIGILRTLCVLVCIVVSSNLVAQVTEVDAYVQDARVGLVDEFFKRFNGTVSHPDVAKTPEEEARKKNLLLLLDLSQYKSEKDSVFKEAKLMMERVIKDSIKINYSDSTWAALAHCRGTIDKKPVSFDLYLTVKHRGDDMYKWVIAKAEGECFNITPQNTGGRIMLYPDDHETKFISLMRMTKEQPFNVRQFMAESFEYDVTSVFSYLVHSQRLKIDYVEELEFIFTQIPGYIFALKNFERESGNSGWLISQFARCSEKEKTEFLKSLYVSTDDDTVGTAVSKSCVLDGEDIYPSSQLQEIFERRKQELIVSIGDYISLIHKNKKTEEQSFYRKKLGDLFISDAKVFVSESSSTSVKNMDELCGFLSKLKKSNVVIVDSVSVPVWWSDDTKTINLDDEEYLLPSVLVSAGLNESNSRYNYHQMLPIRKKHTEDGVEWIPVFGDLYITIK